MKRCAICSEAKPISDFTKLVASKDGYGSRCSPCRKQKKREEYLRNREKYLSSMKAYREANPEKVADAKKVARLKKIEQYSQNARRRYEENRDSILAQAKKYREENKDRRAAQQAEYREENRKKLCEKQKAYYRENKGKVAAYQKRYAELNREKIREGKRKHTKKYGTAMKAARKRKLQRDPLFRLACSMRSSLCKVIARMGYTKKSSSTEILGCDWVTLKEHIEAQFKDGMSWGNRKEWHIDHKTPLASAVDEREVYRLCHYTNLQPLWALDNLRKGARL